MLLTDEAREVKLENGLLFAKILRYYDVSCPVHPLPASLCTVGTEWHAGGLMMIAMYAGGGRQ